jgi:ethanolamine ammonia-lyase large subunit
MLGYLTTAFQDHVRLRQRFGYRVNDAMWAFFRRLGVIDAEGRPTDRFGQPLWVWLQYRRAKGDGRPEADILAEGRERMREVRARGVYLAEGFGRRPEDMAPELDREIRELYADAKRAIWVELDPVFVASLPNAVPLRSRSRDRRDYILHPQTGEELDEASLRTLAALRAAHGGRVQVQIVVSDGLNALAVMDEGHLAPFLAALREGLRRRGLAAADEVLVIRGGRVRAGYRIGERLFGGPPEADVHRAVVHVIGERPGTMHHSFSAYITTAGAGAWGSGRIDHNITRVVSGIADTALKPDLAAGETAQLVADLWGR